MPDPKPVVVEMPTTLKVDVLLSKGSKLLDRAFVYIIPQTAGKNKSHAVATGSTNKVHKIKPGKYYVETSVSNIMASIDIEVMDNKKNHAEIILNAGILSVDAVAEEGGTPIQKAYIYVYDPEVAANGKRKQVAAAHQRTLFTLPAGKYYVTATQGKATAGQEVEIIAAKKTDTIIVLASGLLQVSVLEEESGKPQTRDVYVYIYENEKQTDGRRKSITGANPRNNFALPAGSYYVEAKIGEARVGQTVEVVAGKLTNISIVVGVGALKADVIPIEGGKPLKKAYIRIFEIDKQLDGRRKVITSANQRNIFKLAAGIYHVIAEIGLVKTAQEIEIRPGKLTETTFNLNAGALLVNATRKVHVTIYSADKNLDGSRDRIGSLRPGTSLMMPVGSYLVEGKEGGKAASAVVDIKAGKLTEISLKP